MILALPWNQFYTLLVNKDNTTNSNYSTKLTLQSIKIKRQDFWF